MQRVKETWGGTEGGTVSFFQLQPEAKSTPQAQALSFTKGVLFIRSVFSHSQSVCNLTSKIDAVAFRGATNPRTGKLAKKTCGEEHG